MNLIQDLGNRGENLLTQNISNDEEIKIKLKGQSGQGFVVTNKRIYVLKWGLMVGNTFGGRVNAFEFSRITGIQIQTGLLTGTVEVLTASSKDIKYGGIFDTKSMKSDYAIRVYRKDFPSFVEAVKIARGMLSS